MTPYFCLSTELDTIRFQGGHVRISSIGVTSMPEKPTVPGIPILLTLAGVITSAGAALIVVTEFTGEWWMLPTALGALSAFLFVRQLKDRQGRIRARQELVQGYLDRLLVAKTPEERQPILEEMSSRQLLNGIRLSSSDLEDLDLSHADFSKADLSGATLSGANLSGANLAGATLSYTTLSYTTLRGANLSGANLRGVNLRGADLRQADLSGAFMRGANLAQTALNGANLQNAQLHSANLQDADLREADLTGAVFTRATLPNSSQWEAQTDISRFTDPGHSDFWQANDTNWLADSSRRLR